MLNIPITIETMIPVIPSAVETLLEILFLSFSSLNSMNSLSTRSNILSTATPLVSFSSQIYHIKFSLVDLNIDNKALR